MSNLLDFCRLGFLIGMPVGFSVLFLFFQSIVHDYLRILIVNKITAFYNVQLL